MDPERSLSCSKEPAISPYPEPDESSQNSPTLFRINLILSSHPHLDLPSHLFHFKFSDYNIRQRVQVMKIFITSALQH
jgi:hypothetical protein